ncbi:MAG TPA: molybdopterin-dependent oxidoreductase [Terriglobia bacterium]|nr:molybdopterin-dependent oxidoreductase [Terriglobia bacterium]
MERRDFLKAAALTGATAALDNCGNPEHQLIRFIPEEDLVPGVAEYKPSICTMCPAGCGLMVRVMEGDAEVIRHGEPGLIKMGLAKKLEGNPNHPISQGKLCGRGQAGLQVTYHPDRLRHPLKRSGPRGSGQYQEVSWDEAIKELVSRLSALRSANQPGSLAFLTQTVRGQRRELMEKFLKSFGAPPAVTTELFDDAVLRRANEVSFGRPQLPTFDLARANYVIAFGADFLGTWNSPVAQSVAYGEMRQGRAGVRGKFVMVEARVSQTGASADEWIPGRPGTEGILALGLAHVMIEQKLRRAGDAGHAGSLIEGWSKGLPDYAPPAVEASTGVPAAKIIRLAREMAAHPPSLAMVGGAPLAHSNGMFTALAVNGLNALLGNVGNPGGIFFQPQPPSGKAASGPPTSPKGSFSRVGELIQQAQNGNAPKGLLLYGANPVFTSPSSLGVREALEKIPYIASLGSFIDETSILADLILPDHSPLESWLDDAPESGAIGPVASLSAPAMRPLHNTRAMPDVLLEVAHQLGGEVAAALPWKSYDELLRVTFESYNKPQGKNQAAKPGDFWKTVQERGGVWSSSETASGALAGASHAPAAMLGPEFDGAEKDFPFHFLPYASQMLLDGSLAHLPWMQETPDPISTAMWSTWVEINPKAADGLGIVQGDLVEIASRHGKVQASALISPGIAPDFIAMPVGQGHEYFTRYASGRGANPVAILAPVAVPETGSLAWAATRVKISKVGKGKLVLFAGGIREHPQEGELR